MLRRFQSLPRTSARTAVVATLLLGAWAQVSRALSPTNRVFGVASIGGLAVGASYLRTIQYFGAASGTRGSAHFDLGDCSLRYSQLGVRLWYVGDPLEKGTPKACVHFEEAIATGTDWHTRNGLFVGDSVMKLVRLFPHAYDTRHAGPKTAPSGSVEWDITITCCGGGERPALSVMVRHKRVVALRVAMVGH